MKLCMLCGHAAANDAATCPRDGEASWAKGAPPRADAKALVDAAREVVAGGFPESAYVPSEQMGAPKKRGRK